MRVVKRYRRLWIVDDNDVSIYTPPNFVVVPNRQALQVLADDFNIDSIIAFEAMYARIAKAWR